MTSSTRRTVGRGRRRKVPAAVQEVLFDVQVRPERRFYRQMLDALSRSGFGAAALESELTISRLFGTVWASQAPPRDGSTEEAFGLGLVDYARRHRAPTTVAALQTVAAVAPIREVRDAAAQAAAQLTASGLPVPRWNPPLGALIAGPCWAYEDVFGDESTVICEFGYKAKVSASGPQSGPPDRIQGGRDLRTSDRHAVLVHVDHAIFSVATDVMLVHEVDPLVRDLRNDAKNSASVFVLRQVDPAWARALLARAFARTDLIEGIHTEPAFAELRALALARLEALPDDPGALPAEPPLPSPEQQQALIEEFLASPEAQALPDRPSVAAVAASIIAHGCVYDPGQLTRVGPSKWETFVYDWLPGQPDLPAFPDVARAWTAWAGRRTNLPDVARHDLAAALEDILGDGHGHD